MIQKTASKTSPKSSSNSNNTSLNTPVFKDVLEADISAAGEDECDRGEEQNKVEFPAGIALC